MQAALAALQAALAHDAAGRRAEAIAAFTALLQWVPDHPGAHLRLGQLARAEGRLDAAGEHFRHAAQGARSAGLTADAAPIYAEWSTLERVRGTAAAALDIARAGLTQCGEIPGLIWEECECLRLLGDAPARLQRLNRLARLQPDDPVILTELGFALLDTPSAAQAILPLRRALTLGSSDRRAALMLATLELHTGELALAAERLQQLATRCSNDDERLGVLGVLWFVRKQQCRWLAADALAAQWLPLVTADHVHSALTPFMLLAGPLNPAQLRAYVAHYNARFGPVAAPPTSAGSPPPTAGRRLRVGYLSADLHEHATAILVAGLFERQSRDGVECFVYSYGPRLDDSYRRRLQAAVEHWHDINELADGDAARLIAADQLDVLVEMKGLTFGARPGIAALRPAPRIVHYLGYPGTLCSAGIDLLVADAVVVPADDEPLYAETILRLPRCYQVNDDRRLLPTPPSRASLGLPDDALVLCNFNQAFKWSAPYLEVWLDALRNCPDAVLWLLDPGVEAREAIADMASRAGVAARLHWAPRLPAAQHLARLGAADLALDQLPVASHTTAADALWMAVPVLTQRGEGFHGRVAASLLQAVELEHWVASDIEDYADKLRALLQEPGRIALARSHLAAQRLRLPLFDTAGFARDWEALLRSLCEDRSAVTRQS